MANKVIKYSFTGANQDTTKSKHPVEFYYEANHIKLLATTSQSTASAANEKGNKVVMEIPNIHLNAPLNRLEYDGKILQLTSNSELFSQIFEGGLVSSIDIEDNIIIGHCNTRTGIILFTTNEQGIDGIWNLEGIVNDEYRLELLYIRKLDFSINNPIQALFNYENENIQKVYWVDGKNQIRFINIKYSTIPGNSPLIDVPFTNINFVGQINYSQPEIIDVRSGGKHTAGMIQYAYNLFRLNGSQTKISPVSKLIPLSKGDNLGGGEVNEIVGSSPLVRIDNLDNRYTHIRLYAVKYTSYGEIPSVSLIDEREFTGDSVIILDDGNVIDSLSLAEFLFLGSDPIIPQHIETKDSRLFPANISTQSFLLPDTFDFRAYSFRQQQTTTGVYDSITSYTNGIEGTGYITIDNTYNAPLKHSTINPNLDTNRYLYDSSQEGGSGKLVNYLLLQNSENMLEGNDVEDLRFFKDDEVYRIGIQLYNELGQTSDPHWIADFKAPSGNLKGQYNVLRVIVKQDFKDLVSTYNLENKNAKILGYRILRANRNPEDKTIIDQGVLSNMIYQSKDREYLKNNDNPDPYREIDTALKVPSYLIRHSNNYPSFNGTNTTPFDNDWKWEGFLKSNKHINTLNAEIFVGKGDDSKYQYSWTYDKIMQLYSPSTVFDESFNLTAGMSMRIKGMVNIDEAYTWIQERHINNKKEKYGGKMKNAINYAAGVFVTDDGVILQDNKMDRAARTSNDRDRGYGLYGFINPTGASDTMNFRLFHRTYKDFTLPKVNVQGPILGKPEVAARGMGSKLYNNIGEYKYSNSLQSIVSDDYAGSDEIVAISNVNSYAARNITFMMGDRALPRDQRPGLDWLYNLSRVNEQPGCIGDGILIGELILPKEMIYMGNIYGGNRYEDKKRTIYNQIGDYQNIDDAPKTILSPGDTYVQNFKLMRIGKTDTEVYSADSLQMTEVIEYVTETTIDLKNRNDISFGAWDSAFQPRSEDYNKYNRVYSQASTLVKNQGVDYKFNEVKNFTTRVQASEIKIPNEFIDSWTNLLVNETIELDSKYGPITGLISYKDNIYTFQDEGISALSINPTVQIQSDDGIDIELGKGGILDDYKYLTTKSGSINKWSIVAGKKGIYYYDALNRAIGRVPDGVEFLLSDMKGMHSFYNNNYIYDDVKIDNPILKKGALFGTDKYNNDIYFTLLQNSKNKKFSSPGTDGGSILVKPSTWCFNEIIDQFVDLKPGYSDPSMYINKGDKLLISKDNNRLYEQYAGRYNHFFGEYHPSTVTLVVNPESDLECVFDNIHYNSEIYLNDIDQPDKTLTHIRAWNEYQDSGKIPLIVGRGSNIRRKFREWQADIPREGRDRIRNSWIYLYLELDNESNYKMILHDIIIRYTV